MLYGTSAADWNLVKFRDEVGAFPYTIQQFGQTIFLDDRGIKRLNTVQAFGNFQHDTISRTIQSFINQKKTIVNASCIARDKNQYRLFFSDKSGLYITTEGRRIVGLMPVSFTDAVEVCASVEDSTGVEQIMFGSTDGKVYQLDKGTSFDGDAINAYFKTHFTYSRELEYLKRYLSCTIEVAGDGYAEFDFTYELQYSQVNTPQPGSETKTQDFSATIWDQFTWDAAFWDGQTLSPTSMKLTGSAENISLIVRKNSDYFLPLTHSGRIYGITLEGC